MTLSRFLCAGAFVLLAATAAAAKPGVTNTTVNLRADPNTASDVLAKIPAGARVEVGECDDGWCAVTYQGKSGHTIQSALDTSGRAPRVARRGPPRGYAPYDDDDMVVRGDAPPGYVRVPPPGYVVRPYYRPYWGWGPYWGPRWWW
jgi:hypothetical protein